jgi:hypothetical protein
MIESGHRFEQEGPPGRSHPWRDTYGDALT